MVNVNAAVSASGLNEKKHWAARTDPARGRPANQCSRFACILLKLPRFCAKTVRQTRHLATRVRTSRITDFRIGNHVIVARASVDFETPSATRQSLSNFYRLWCGGHSGRKSVGTPTDRLPFIAFGSLIVIMRALGNGGTGCAVPRYDVPYTEAGQPTVKSIVQRIQCEIRDMVRDDTDDPAAFHGRFL